MEGITVIGGNYVYICFRVVFTLLVEGIIGGRWRSSPGNSELTFEYTQARPHSHHYFHSEERLLHTILSFL